MKRFNTKLSWIILGGILFLATPSIVFSHKIDFRVTPIEKIFPQYVPSLSNGKMVFDKHCRKCHDSGKVPKNSVDFWDEEEIRFTYSAYHYFFLTSVGRRKMPSFDFTEEEHWDVVFYIRSLTSKKESVTLGERYFIKLCKSCHEGKTNNMQTGKNLTAQNWNHRRTDDEILANLTDRYESGRGKQVKTNILEGFDEKARWSLVDYLRSLQYQD